MRINLSLLFFSVILLVSAVSAQSSLKCLTNDLPKSLEYTLRTPDGMTLFIEERGNILKPTLILTHGFFSSRLVWETTFTSHNMFDNYHLVRWDLRGMGDSSKDSDLNKYNNLQLYANDVNLIVNSIKKRKENVQSKIILVTWSTGSLVTLSYFNSTGDSNVDGYVSVGNNFISFQNDNIFSEYIKVTIGSIVTSQTYIYVLDSLNSLIKSFTSLNSPFSFPPPILNFFVGIGAYSPYESRLAYGQFTYDYTETFTNLLIPTLNIYGNDDRVVNPMHSQAIAKLRPINGLNHILAYDGIGHVPMWENSAKFENDLNAWIKTVILNPKNNPKDSKLPLKSPPQPLHPSNPQQPQQKRRLNE
ncbi:Alpha/Beta hydrolase protein [Glomus cerebriforme]|uniref:Alpha/Beta hydrolase protein n=1 Tax=Glomus cerebriforme TaxID=658196 RepID=A0A397T0Q5_9GLOM|nr:Alpha/Beta hydrolase protein [Glomus cerebriforme]